MTRAQRQLAAIWCVSIWPALNFTARNWADVVNDGIVAFGGVLAITLVIGAIGHLFHRAVSHRGLGGFAVMMSLLAICLFFGYSLIHDAGAALLDHFYIGGPPSAVWVVVAILSAFIVFRLRRHEGLQVAASVFCFTAMFLALGQLFLTAIRTPKTTVDIPMVSSVHSAPSVAKPVGMNVYYILLDYYAGTDELREFTGFDNSDFMQLMAQRGFVDATKHGTDSVRSNYLMTQQTVGSIFSLDYVKTDEPGTWNDSSRLYPHIVNGAPVPPLVAGLKTAGYSTWETFNSWSGCSGRHLRCLGGQGSLDFDYMTMAFLSPTPLGRAITILLGRRVDGIVAIATHLPTVMSSKEPFFIFVHSLAAHPPYFPGADCSPRGKTEDEFDGGSAYARQAYVEALKCVNSKVIELVDRILRGNPNAMIVIESDHGTAFTADWEQPISSWPDAFVRERSSFLNLIKAPDVCKPWLDRPLGQVNTARFVLSCAQGRAPEYLPQRTYLASYSKAPSNRGIVRLEQRKAPWN
jgi:hypothetical protein